MKARAAAEDTKDSWDARRGEAVTPGVLGGECQSVTTSPCHRTLGARCQMGTRMQRREEKRENPWIVLSDFSF